jgi:hypothetical protein
LQNRVDKLAANEFIFSDLLALAQMSEEEFDSLLVEAKKSFDDKESQRICEEEKRKEENLLALKNHARSLILNASTFLELA